MRQRARVMGGVGVVSFHLLALLSSCHTILGLTGGSEDSVSNEGGLLRPEDAGAAGSSGRSSVLDPPVADPADPCTTYCASIASVCTGALRQYANSTDCAKLCPELQRGDGRALRCRSTALTEYGETGCATAGPTGRTTRQDVPSCVEDACETYCELMRSTCDDTSLGEPDDPSAEDGPTPADRAACLEVCASVPSSPDYSVSPSLPAGNNINCRIHHINLAVGAAPGSDPRKDHCEHAAGRAGLFALTTVPCQER